MFLLNNYVKLVMPILLKKYIKTFITEGYLDSKYSVKVLNPNERCEDCAGTGVYEPAFGPVRKCDTCGGSGQKKVEGTRTWVGNLDINDIFKRLPVVNPWFHVRKHIKLSDGTELSIQASRSHYSSPKQNNAPVYEEFEVESSRPISEWQEYLDIGSTYVYGYVPASLINNVLNKHGLHQDSIQQ